MAIIEVVHGNPCYVCGSSDNGRDGVHVCFAWDEDAEEVRCQATLGPDCQGAPGHAHGGSLFAILDEAMGAACWMSGHKVMSASVTIDYRRPVKIGDVLDIAAKIVKVDGRKVHTVGALSLEGQVVTEARGLFISSERHAWDLLPPGHKPDLGKANPA